jgi:hypothetical protein
MSVKILMLTRVKFWPKTESLLSTIIFWGLNATEMMKIHKSPSTYQILAKFLKVEGTKFAFWDPQTFVWFGIRKNVPSVVARICKTVHKNYCRKFPRIPLLQTSYNILSNIFLLRLTPYVSSHEITGDHECEFRRTAKTTDQIFCIRHILKKNGNAWVTTCFRHIIQPRCTPHMLSVSLHSSE